MRNTLAGSDALRSLVVVTLVDSIGTGVFQSGSALFFTRSLGLSSTEVGVGLSLAAGLGLISTVPIGMLADRWGPRPTLIAIQIWRGGCFLLYAQAGGLSFFLVVACMLGLANQAAIPITQALIACIVGQRSRVHGMARIRAVHNLGVAVGAILSLAVVADHPWLGYRGVVVIDGLSFWIAASLLWRLRASAPVPGVGRTSPWMALRGLRDGWYAVVAGLNGAMTLHNTLLTVGIPLWIVAQTRAPHWTLAVVFLVNTGMAVLLQVGVAGRRLRDAGWALAGCAALAALGASVGAALAVVTILAAMVALTLGELWQSAAGWGLATELAPPEAQGTYLAVFSLGFTIQTVVGPALVTLLVLAHGQIGWAALGGALGVLSLAVKPVADRAAVRARARDHPSPGCLEPE
jgi:MFS family permease